MRSAGVRGERSSLRSKVGLVAPSRGPDVAESQSVRADIPTVSSANAAKWCTW